MFQLFWFTFFHFMSVQISSSVWHYRKNKKLKIWVTNELIMRFLMQHFSTQKMWLVKYVALASATTAAKQLLVSKQHDDIHLRSFFEDDNLKWTPSFWFSDFSIFVNSKSTNTKSKTTSKTTKHKILTMFNSS